MGILSDHREVKRIRTELIEIGLVEGKQDWVCQCVDCKPTNTPMKYRGTKTDARARGWQISNTSNDRIFSPLCARNRSRS